MDDWLFQLRQQHPHARVAICLEQPAASLILFLEAYAWITLYAINPITLRKFRQAFATSRAKDAGPAEKLRTRHKAGRVPMDSPRSETNLQFDTGH